MSNLKERARKAFEEKVIHTRSYNDERDSNGLYVQEGLQTAWRNFYRGYQSAIDSGANNLTGIAQKKIEQMGATVLGVMVKNEAGAWAAVSDAGRVMWLDDFEWQATEADKAGGGDA